MSNHNHIRDSLLTKKWVASDENKIFFEIDQNIWNELQNGTLAFQFNFVSESGLTVILYDSSRKYYVSLDQKFAKLGYDTNGINMIINNGTWITS